jgi:hypothetical protein
VQNRRCRCSTQRTERSYGQYAIGDRDRELSPRARDIVTEKLTLEVEDGDYCHQLSVIAIITIKMNEKGIRWLLARVGGRYGMPNAPLTSPFGRFSIGMIRHPIETSSTAFRLCVFTGRASLVHARWQS